MKEQARIIARYLGSYRNDLLLMAGLSLLAATTGAAVPFLAGRLIDSILAPDPLSTVLGVNVPGPLLFVVPWLALRLLGDLTDRQLSTRRDRVGIRIEGDYVVDGIGRVLALPVSFHKSHKMGEVFEQISRAGSWLSHLTSRILIDLTPQFLSVGAALAVAFSIKPEFALVLLTALLVYAAILLTGTAGLALFHRQMHDAYASAWGSAFETLTNVPAVKQATAEDYERQKHRANFHEGAIQAWLSLNGIWRNLAFSQRLLISVTQLAVFLLAIWQIRRGEMSVGELVMFNGYAAMLFGPLVTVGHNWQTVQNGLAALAQAERVLQTPPEVYHHPRRSVTLGRLRGAVEFREVSFGYEKPSGTLHFLLSGPAGDEGAPRGVLHGISFCAEPGMTVALVGESGGGKSTLVDMISLYNVPDEGQVLIDGHDLRVVDLVALRDQISVVPQDTVLFNDSIANNIRYGRFAASDAAVSAAARLAHADEFIERFPEGYGQIVGERGVKLSAGQKQRIAIARAILRDPRILILDEYTSALDARSEQLITASLGGLMRGRTTFIIAHQLSTVWNADLILVLHHGCITESGTHFELMDRPEGIYRRLYQLQIGLRS